MKTERANIDDLLVIHTKIFCDRRGFFTELFKEETYHALGIPFLVQFNYSFSERNVLRGLHYQTKPFEQGKLVSVLSGQIQDVAVDIRKNSKTFGKYFDIILYQGVQLWIPPGFAHGFLSLTDNTSVVYGCSGAYSAPHERGVVWNDSSINISWKTSSGLIISDRDKSWPQLSDLKGGS